ncbi:MAG: hypothetical protein ABL958_20830, partial [Bdellovibrionia bacterium]
GAAGGGGAPSAITETQTRRSSERFNIIDWIRSNNAAKAAQDSKYGRGGGGSGGRGPFPDFVFQYRASPTTLNREGTKLGTYSETAGRFQFLLDDLFTQGDRFRTLNSDLGFEFSYAQAKEFQVDPAVTQAKYEYKEMAGALLIRPIGRSSQDTGLTIKVGYTNLEETGFFADTIVPVNLYGMFLGADVKMYLLPFLGLKAEYQYGLESAAGDLTGKWKASKFTYGAFLEIYLLSIEGYLFNKEVSLTPDTGSAIKETATGTALGASLYF